MRRCYVAVEDFSGGDDREDRVELGLFFELVFLELDQRFVRSSEDVHEAVLVSQLVDRCFDGELFCVK